MYSHVFDLHAQLLKALAHPRRLEIIQLLRDQQLYVSDIYEMLDLPQANISQHLTILRDAGVVTTHRHGKQIQYAISDPQILAACDTLRNVLIKQHQNEKLADTLTLKMTDLVPLTHDPVCNMRISPKTAGAEHTYKNHQYFFCASGCHKKFIQHPEDYATA